MRRPAVLAALWALCAMTLVSPAYAQSDWRFDARHVVLGYLTRQGVQTDGPYNTANRLAQIPRTLADVEWREDWRLRTQHCNAALDVRLMARKVIAAEPGIERGASTDGFVRAGGGACRFGAGFEWRAGREVLQWGNATFRSPSNPFITDTGKTHPIRELVGKDVVQLGWRGDSGVSLTALRTIGSSSRDDTANPFRATTALRADHVGATQSGGLILARPDGGRWQAGGYVTRTVSDAWLVYGDAKLRRGSDGLYPLPDAAAPGGWRFAPLHTRDSRLRGSALFGAAYTFESGWSLTGELLLNNEGYNASERAQARQAVMSANDLLFSGLPNAGAGAAVIADALQHRMQVGARRYLFLQLLRTEWNNRADVALRWAHNLDDHGSSLSGSLTYVLGDRTQLLWIGTLNTGARDAEFSRLVRYSTLLGLRFSL